MRHGRSALPFPDCWITPAEFREWISVYNRTGTAPDDHPTDEIVAKMRDVSEIVCSDSPRSVESAGRIAPDHRPRVSATFREVGRPLQTNWKIRLPLDGWDRLSVLLWKFGLISANEPFRAARQRAQQATHELVSLAHQSFRVLFVGHGMLNALIVRRLLREGWRGPKRANDDYWGLVSYCKEA